MAYSWKGAVLLAAAFALGWTAKWLYDRGAPRKELEGPRKLELSIEDGGSYRVKEVIDGDTIKLENGLHVRYQGVNTPETGRFVTDPAPLSAEATARNRELVEGKLVRLRFGVEPMDAHGRLLARVDVVSGAGETIDVETLLIKEGLAKVFGRGLASEDYQALKRAQAEAEQAKAGMWGLTKPATEAEQAQFPFCGAARGSVFHKAECAQAKRIAPENYHGYRSLEEARAGGRRPCSQCLKDLK